MRSTETDPDAGDLKLAKTAVQAIGLGSILSAEAVVSDEISPEPSQRSFLMQLKLATRTKDGVLIVNCNGRIVFGEESSLLRDTVKKAIPENKRIILNLGEVTYIDSGGLGTLVSLHTTAQLAGTSIKLANLTKRVGDLLQVTKLLTVFDVHNSEGEALESFKGAAA